MAGELVVRDLSTGVEHPLESTCPAVQRPDQDDPDELTKRIPVVFTEDSAMVLCAGPVVTVDVYSRTDGARTASLSGTGRRRELTTVPGLLPAAGAIVLVVQDFDTDPAVMDGLT